MPALLGDKGNEKALSLGLKTLLTSLGHQSAGALALFNYPTWLRKVTSQNRDGTVRPDPVDLASLEGKPRGNSSRLFFGSFHLLEEGGLSGLVVLHCGEFSVLFESSFPRQRAIYCALQPVPEEFDDAHNQEVGGSDTGQGIPSNHP
jgi:hypothetical protein